MKTTFLLVALMMSSTMPSSTSGDSPPVPPGDRKVSKHTVKPGETYTAEDGTTVKVEGSVNVKVTTYRTKVNGEWVKYTITEPSRGGADFSVSGLDNCKDKVNINGLNTKAKIDGDNYTVNIRGKGGDITIDGDHAHVNGTNMGSDNTIKQNGNHCKGNMGKHGSSDLIVNGDHNSWGRMDGDSAKVSGQDNTMSSEKQDTSC